MKKPGNKALIIGVAALALLCVAAIFIGRSLSCGERIARITQNGVVLYEIDLNAVTEPYTIELSGNTVLIERGAVSMLDADCPDRLCVKQGVITQGVYPIVCLPNGVTISIESRGELDAIVG